MTWFQMKLITSSNLEGLLENPISSFEYDGLKLSRNFYRTTFISFFPAGTVGFSFPLSQFPIGIQSSLIYFLENAKEYDPMTAINLELVFNQLCWEETK